MKPKTYGKKKAKRATITLPIRSAEAKAPSSQRNGKQKQLSKSREPPLKETNRFPGPSPKRTVSPASSPVLLGAPATTFHDFRRLPLELQSQIWRYAIAATRTRIVIWRSPVVPALLRTCIRSRTLFLEENKIEHWRTGALSEEVLFINWEDNVVFFRGRIPGLAEWDEAPKRVERPVRKSTGWVPHLELNPQTGGKWLEDIRYMALSLKVVVQCLMRKLTEVIEDTEVGWRTLNRLCPKLEILYITTPEGREFGVKDTLGDLVQNEQLRVVKNCYCMPRGWARNIARDLRAVQYGEPDLLPGLKLCFIELRDADAKFSESTWSTILPLGACPICLREGTGGWTTLQQASIDNNEVYITGN
ncbi:hypothetical protein EG329_014149 [Mollisiaceae sp. DMI_Dod_QoI]|nr:hypothetical protein EG329_014149 [Helotiales sp. DMI_Dod_QoI]